MLDKKKNEIIGEWEDLLWRGLKLSTIRWRKACTEVGSYDGVGWNLKIEIEVEIEVEIQNIRKGFYRYMLFIVRTPYH